MAELGDGKLLIGKLALVTGATSGLGRAMAYALARNGAEVIVVSRKPDACQRVAKEIADATGQATYGIATHVGKWNEIDRLVQTVVDHHRTPDILINNAGISPLYESIESITEELFDKTIAVNLRGTFRLSALIGRRMVADGGGSIINVSSVGAIRPDPYSLPYCAAKAGVEVLTGGLAKVFAPTVRVNCIMPGAFMTGMASGWPEELADQFLTDAPLRRIGDPDEITGAAIYLASDQSSFTTGAILRVDGGLSL
jgi:NAD(P)-dependent dehydrogenase (short-subunit alcohol dehydrogenase family)